MGLQGDVPGSIQSLIYLVLPMINSILVAKDHLMGYPPINKPWVD